MSSDGIKKPTSLSTLFAPPVPPEAREATAQPEKNEGTTTATQQAPAEDVEASTAPSMNPGAPLASLFAPARAIRTRIRTGSSIASSVPNTSDAPATRQKQHPEDSIRMEASSSSSSPQANLGASLTSLFAPTPLASGKTNMISGNNNQMPFVPLLQKKKNGAQNKSSEKSPLLQHFPASKQQFYSNRQDEDDEDDDDDFLPGTPTQAFRAAKKARSDSAHRQEQESSSSSSFYHYWKRFAKKHLQPTTFAGALMFLLYHVVFCLANGSAIILSHKQILGAMAKMTTVGIMFAAPFYIFRLGPDIPALYPSIDLFLAPFLAQAAAQVDASLNEQYGTDYADTLFFGSFAVLVAMGMFLAGSLLLLAGTFKLANLGTYLPYSVLCGFFSAVGVLLWALAFSVDTTGLTWKQVLLSGDGSLMWNSCLHHIPSLIVGILMNRLGPKNPFFVILLIIATLVLFYISMWVTDTSLEEAQEAKWFWSRDELVYHHSAEGGILLPPAPFGSFGALVAGQVNWTAVGSGLGNMAALAFLYLLRSSIHASAMKKNVNNLVRRVPVETPVELDNHASTARQAYDIASSMYGSAKLGVQSVNMSIAKMKKAKQEHEGDEPDFTEVRAKPSKMTLEEIFTEYGYALYVVAFCGGFGNCPTVATSNTMYAIGAEGPAPQYGSVLLLVIFYFTDFALVRFIPKAAFSSLLVLGAVDTLVVWFIQSFRKTQDLAEWMVVPFIVLFSLFVGFLNAVFLGIAISMFVFVASFFRIGVVKYNATGLEIRSRIERPMAQSMWLDENGDLIQVIVLQNYLFFGNAIGIRNYIETMFEEVDESKSRRLDFALPPKPRLLVVDLGLITGMDTSTVDIFAEIKEMCAENACKLYLCGLSSRMKRGLSLGGVKPGTGPRSKSSVRFFSDLDTALGNAEDELIRIEMTEAFKSRWITKRGENGFRHALQQIDEVHGQAFAQGLYGLEPYCEPLVLEPDEFLFQCDGGSIQEKNRGLFLIESGLLKIEREASEQLTATRSLFSSRTTTASYTLKNQHARMGSLARIAALAKRNQQGTSSSSLRLARFGPGWVVGALENSGLRPAGCVTAVSECRLHHLPFHKLEEIERDHPALVLRLYKMLSHIIARREQTTVEHLHTLHNIISSPAHSKPMSRAALRAIEGA